MCCLMLVNSAVSAQLLVSNACTGLQLTGTPVANAVSYRFAYTGASDQFCGAPGCCTTQIGTSSQPSIVHAIDTAAYYWYRMEAISATGAVLSTQNFGPQWFHLPGPVPLTTGSQIRRAVVNETLLLRLRDPIPSDATIQWLRNGVELVGATSSTLQWTVSEADAGATFTPTVLNACGTSIGVTQEIEIIAIPVSGVTVTGGSGQILRRHLESWQSQCHTQSCWVIGEYRSEFDVANVVAWNSTGFTIQPMGSPYRDYVESYLQVAFEVSTPVLLTLSGYNHIPITDYGSPGPCGWVSNQLTGSAAQGLPSAAGPWSASITLQPGAHSMSFSAFAGQVSCPSSIFPAPCTGSIGLTLTASFIPLEFTVPTQYPTIQAAIDATPAGTARTINVLAGTYNETFALNGKNIVVRGAPGNATILNGAKLTTSIARFTGNEPATAGLENLVFRNGTVGQPINPPSYNFTGGGGVFGKDSSAFIKNCRFEDCGADFGAGVYLLRCTVNVDGCVFSSNDATTDGGGMQTFACSGTIRNSTFTGNRCALTYAGSGSAFKGVGIRTAGTTLALEACTISGNPIPNAGAAVEYFENVKVLAGVFRIVDTDIMSNTVGSGTVDDAGGLRVLGRQQSCVLSGGTTICSNTPRNVVGPYLIDGSATVCDCEGDLSGNGQVDAADLGILLSVWGTSPANGQGDLNHDGIVSAPDLSALLARWGVCQ